VAAGSVLGELMVGRESAAAPRLAAQLADIVAGRGGAPDADPRLRAFAPLARVPARQRCALLPWEALAAALDDADAKR
jgi:NifU-like protein involved in Fe-S cluster formation